MNTYNYAIEGENFICYQSDGVTVYYSIPVFYPVININSDTIAFSEDNYTIFKLKYSSFIQLKLSNGTILTKSDFQNSNALFSQISSIFAITSSGGGGGQEFTGIIEANMDQAFNICDIYPKKTIYEVSAKISSSNLTNTATIFYNQKQSENNGFVSLLTYFMDDSQNKPLLFFPQSCVNLQNKLQIIIKNNTNELINFNLITN